jgi:hypothetical protein
MERLAACGKSRASTPSVCVRFGPFDLRTRAGFFLNSALMESTVANSQAPSPSRLVSERLLGMTPATTRTLGKTFN